MRKLSSLPKERIKALFLDLDGTLTRGPRLMASTYQYLEKLAEAGYWTVIVSGRPAGWADCLMRLSPIHAMIFENGAGLFMREDNGIKLQPLAPSSDTARTDLLAIFEKLKKARPQLRLATDQPFRLYDCAIDIWEQRPQLDKKDAEWVLAQLKKEPGITAKLSSIHVNFWKGSYDKRSACEYLLRGEGEKRGVEKSDVVYVGDSPNDEPMFEYFTMTVGVANIRLFWDQLEHKPSYLTDQPEGGGFEELAKFLLQKT